MEIYPTADNPAPLGAVVHKVVTRDGAELRALSAPAPVNNAMGTIVFVQGRADFMERYFESMRTAQDLKYAVAAFDFRGQGGSQRLLRSRLRGHARRFADYDEDLRSVLAQLASWNCPKPYFAIGHSTGGNVVLRSLRYKTPLSRVVVTAPLVDLHFGAWPRWAVSSLTALASAFALSWLYLPGLAKLPFLPKDFPGNPLTSDKQRFERDMQTLVEFPVLAVGAPTFGWLQAARASIAELKRWPRKQAVSCPTLIVAAGRETVVEPRAAREFSERVPGVSYIEIKDSLHEILMERDTIRKPFWKAADAFFNPP
jgi:lysophospholipase